jgi:WD40 repeat protein
MSQLEELERQAVLPDCPYVGLRDYTEEYAEFFFGRDDERKRIIGNLRASRLTLLYAESGVGKSSLLRAGVVPRLRQFAERGRGATSARYVPVIFSSWGGDPIEALIDAIAEAVETFIGIAPELPRGTLAEAVAAASAATDATMLVILDQFEEMFLYHSRGSDDDRFAAELARCVSRADLRANFLISIREDAYASVGDLLKGRVPNVYGNYLHLDYLDRKAATEAIVKPIERFNQLRPSEPPVSIEPELLDAVLDQVRRGQVETRESETAPAAHPDLGAARSIETTYLQLVMKRLWDEESVLGSTMLRLETLERLGGAQRIIGTHLDHAMTELPGDQRDAAAAVFRFLVTSTGTKIALTVTDLTDLSGLPEASVDPMLRRLSAPDRHILRPVVLRDSPDRARFEIFHDALARPILDWRTRYARQKLDAQLDDERRQKERAQREAVDAEERESRERKRKRLALAGLAVAIIALLATATAFAISQKNAADREAAYADAISAVRRIEGAFGSPSLGSDAVALEGLELARAGGGFPARVLALGALQSNVAMPAIGTGHTRSGYAVTFLSNSIVASGSADATIRLWSSRARSLVTDPLSTDSVEIVSGLAVGSRDGRRTLAAARGDGDIDLWDVTRPKAPKREAHFTVTEEQLNDVAFSPDGTQIAVGGHDEQVSFLDVTDPSEPKKLGSVGALSRVHDLTFNAQGTQLAVAGDDGVALLAGPDFAHATPVWLDTDHATLAVAFSPDGTLAYALNSTTHPGIALRDAAGVTRVLATTNVVNSLAFAGGGKVLVSGGDDANVTTWDVRTAREFGPPRMEDRGNAVIGIGVSPDGKMIAEVGASHALKVWPLVVKDPLATTVGSLAGSDIGQEGEWSQPDIRALAIGPDGQVAAAAKDGGAVIWRRDSGAHGSLPSNFTKIPPKADSWTNAVAYDHDVLAVASGDSVTTWRTGPKCRDWPKAACPLSREKTTESGVPGSAMSFDRSGKWLAAGDSSGHVTLWPVHDGKLGNGISWNADASKVYAVAFSPTADLIATAGTGGRIEVRDLQHPLSHVRRVRGHHQQAVAALAFSPDGEILASGGLDQESVLWSIDAEADRPIRQLPGLPLFQTNSILALAFSPNGKVLAAGDGDGAACLYDVKSRKTIGICLTARYGSLSNVGALAFTRDGTGLLTAGQGNPVVRWNSVLWSATDDEASSDQIAAAACRFAGRNLTEDEWGQAFADTELAGDWHKTCPAYPLS